MNNPLRSDDQNHIMSVIGEMVPLLLREAVSEGFNNYSKNRNLDPDSFADYSACTRANMLNNRITASAKELVDLATNECSGLCWRTGPNGSSTEFMMEPNFVFRFKRGKQNRGGLSTNVDTKRQRAIKSPSMLSIGQMVLPFRNESNYFSDEQRLWLTLTYDLDELEEYLSKVFIGVELKTRHLWKIPLRESEPDVIARLPVMLADRITDMRNRRLA